VVNFTPRPLYPRGKIHLYPLDRRLGGPQSFSGRDGEKKFSAPAGNRTLELRSVHLNGAANSLRFRLNPCYKFVDSSRGLEKCVERKGKVGSVHN
jgi:hypothetical protein